MADSPSEKTKEAAVKDSESKTNTVPQQRVDELAAQKNEAKAQAEAARAKVATLQEELRKAQEQTLGMDPSVFAALVTETVNQQTNAIVEQHMKPLRDELAMRRVQAQTGLNDEQYAAVREYESKGLSLEESVTLARAKKPELFGVSAGAFDPRMGGVLPPGGDSMARQAPKPEDWGKKLREAGSLEEAKHAAANMLHQQIQRARGQAARMNSQ